MPMNWTPEADAKLFVKVLNVSNIKLSQDVLDAIASEMSPDCTGRAIKERIFKLKQKAAGPGNSTAASTTPRAPRTPKTPRSAKGPKSTPGTGRKRKGANVAGPLDDAGTDDDEDIKTFVTPSKQKTEYADEYGSTGSQDENQESPSKRIKREPSNEFESEMWVPDNAHDDFVRGQSGDLF
ncbi:uncharacterized protein BDZ99DRAFT_462382 [Mytilinidion resinicola]|uniref:Uncharacterized protein n=1 Tax=Mytilinidion resinicola TaxID=574789 RepID=A0A6A6YT14_9PEZI|nr:uncharacterized protein BDZ99DRAFT_462382 [Mytilinidion resinicola]KAF2811105.1 hypothetical protein BDZ99DRAFT_462382 [Mytilinidion resinicola]